MPKKKSQSKLSEWSVNALSLETGFDRRFIGKLLADVPPLRQQGTTKFYRLKDFCEMLRGSSLSEFSTERLLKLKAERELAQLQVRRENNESFSIESVWHIFSK